jgi:hypothetical protein
MNARDQHALQAKLMLRIIALTRRLNLWRDVNLRLKPRHIHPLYRVSADLVFC